MAQRQHRQGARFRPQQQRPQYDYYYDDYYYDYDYPQEAEKRPQEQPQQQEADYDLGELVKAWKEYIKERNQGGGRGRPRRPQLPEVEYECPPQDDSYRTPDEKQCDKYYECNIKGEISEHLCADGLVFDVKTENCDYPAKVNCGNRTELQEPQPSKNCPRANGFFAFPANETCQKFWDCRGGQAYLQICPAGVIYDPMIAACVTPDQSRRPECAATKFLGFQCPTYGPDEPLRFGNHDRLANPENCQQFFSCLRSGEPRLGACPRMRVFNNATGQCADPKKVPGCEDFWVGKEENDYDYY